ncbi:MAG TPA: Gfo/Idh/MocA family oxidoreductase [Burkholderiales bacterium]|nr:Gfo/Idh/MocA family oxidoreductase [Burkholderiales bacterium]
MSDPTIAVIGCGAVAEAFYVPALRKRPGLARSLVLVDPDRSRAEALRERLGAREALTDYRAALGRIAGALVLTPHHLHVPITLELARHGVAVLCEKPLAETPAEVDAIVEASRAHRAPVMVNQTRRLFPAAREVKRLIGAGALGELREIHFELGAPFDWPAATPAYFHGGRGVLFDTGVHVVDLVCWWLGGEPKLVDYADDARGGTEAVARVKLALRGVEAHIHLSWLTKLRNAYRIAGAKATIEGGAYDWASFTLAGRKVHASRAWQGYEDFVGGLLDNFVQVIAGRAEPLVTAADVRPAIALIDQCYRQRKNLHEPWHDAWQRLFVQERKAANG